MSTTDSTTQPPLAPWPYPAWIAHRGAGRLAPENTLAAFQLGAQLGYRCFECDVKLSQDGVLFLLHDDTLARTTNGDGIAGTLPWSALCLLDAGAWHSAAHAGEPLPTLQAIAAFVLSQSCSLNIEIKPTPGQDYETGLATGHAADALWDGHLPKPLLSSFKPEALRGALTAAPSLPRVLLLDKLWGGWMEAAQALQVSAIITQNRLMTAPLMQQLRAAGLRSAVYTVNDADIAERLRHMGVDSIITDAVDRLPLRD